MINVYVKIGTKAISKKMGKVSPQIIHHNHAYVKGRTIFDAARTIDDVMSLTSSKNISSLLVAIDFENAKARPFQHNCRGARSGASIQSS